jgi:hypothetical protein
MTAAAYAFFWVLAIIGALAHVIVLPILGVIGCVVVVYYSTRGHRLGVRRNPRSPRGLWLERDAGVPRG